VASVSILRRRLVSPVRARYPSRVSTFTSIEVSDGRKPASNEFDESVTDDSETHVEVVGVGDRGEQARQLGGRLERNELVVEQGARDEAEDPDVRSDVEDRPAEQLGAGEEAGHRLGLVAGQTVALQELRDVVPVRRLDPEARAVLVERGVGQAVERSVALAARSVDVRQPQLEVAHLVAPSTVLLAASARLALEDPALGHPLVVEGAVERRLVDAVLQGDLAQGLALLVRLLRQASRALVADLGHQGGDLHQRPLDELGP
jgi:hypothetical protein